MVKVHKISDTNSITTMDVVFVHGLNGDPIKTWTNDKDCFWPNWLLDDLPEADLWTVGYDASPTKWKRETLSFFERSQSILENLKTSGIGSRPVCFVCHSLGGLVVKQILRRSNENNSLRQNCYLYNNTKSITFLAVPHQGSQYANIFSRFSFLRATKLVNYLKRNEDYINDLYYFFRNTSIPILSFYETERTPLLKRSAFCKKVPIINDCLWPIIVPEKSADCGSGERPIPIEENHYNICKFSNKDEMHYKKLLFFIKSNMSDVSVSSVQNSFIDNAEISKIDRNVIDIKSSISEGNWIKSSQLICECEVILDNNTELPNRADTYLFLAEAEKSRVDGLSDMISQRKDYNKVKTLIDKAKRANG